MSHGGNESGGRLASHVCLRPQRPRSRHKLPASPVHLDREEKTCALAAQWLTLPFRCVTDEDVYILCVSVCTSEAGSSHDCLSSDSQQKGPHNESCAVTWVQSLYIIQTHTNWNYSPLNEFSIDMPSFWSQQYLPHLCLTHPQSAVQDDISS